MTYFKYLRHSAFTMLGNMKSITGISMDTVYKRRKDHTERKSITINPKDDSNQARWCLGVITVPSRDKSAALAMRNANRAAQLHLQRFLQSFVRLCGHLEGQ